MIGEYDNAFSAKYCNDVIEIFERIRSYGTIQEQRGMKRNSDDRVMYDWAPHNNMHYYHHDVCTEFFAKLHNCYLQYADKYESIKDLNSHSPKGMSIQRTGPMQGYHIWHSESVGISTGSRLLAYTLYLNNVDEGGETEYLYQGLKIKPEQGKVVIWPAGFTHPHRGNPIYKGFKYIITGWYTYDE
jgi:hypothetical protein